MGLVSDSTLLQGLTNYTRDRHTTRKSGVIRLMQKLELLYDYVNTLAAQSGTNVSAPANVYVSTDSGDDANDGLTTSTRVLTLARAYEIAVPLAASGTEVIINLDGTGATALTPVEYTLPSSGAVAALAPAVKNDGPVARIRILGDTFQDFGATYNVDAITGTSATAGWVLDLPGAFAADVVRRFFFRNDGTNGTADGVEGLCYRITTGGVTYGVPQWTASGYPGSPGVADTVQFLEPSCKVVIPGDGDYVLQNIDLGSVAIGTADAADDNGVLVLAGSACRFNRCVVEVGTIDVCCEKFVTDFVILANVGDNDASNPGMMRIRKGTTWQCGQGLVIDGENAEGVASAHVKIEGHLDLRCQVTARELGTYGIFFAGGTIGSGLGSGADSPDIGFDDCDAGLLFNRLSATDEETTGGGGYVKLHNRGSATDGVTGSVFVVEAVGDVDLIIDTASDATGSASSTRYSWNRLADPGDAGTITAKGTSSNCAMTSAGTETRTLANPTHAGQRIQLSLDVLTGTDVDVAVAAGTIDGTNTTMTFNAVGEMIELVATDRGGLYWTLVTNIGSVGLS